MILASAATRRCLPGRRILQPRQNVVVNFWTWKRFGGQVSIRYRTAKIAAAAPRVVWPPHPLVILLTMDLLSIVRQILSALVSQGHKHGEV